MKIWFFSDTHGKHDLLVPPDVDCMVFCGDESNSKDAVNNEVEALPFFDWYDSLDCDSKIYIAGNHSAAVSYGLIKPDVYETIMYLYHDSCVIDGVKIFGSPYTPMFSNWYFMRNRGRMHDLWSSIPYDTDILVTHGPPQGILDLTHYQNELVQCGCKALLKKVIAIKPKIHAFGHVHDHKGIYNFGCLDRDEVKFINCSVDRHHTEEINQGIVIEYSK